MSRQKNDLGEAMRTTDFEDREVSFLSADGSTRLAGTLAVPAGDRTGAAVVLVSGTGPVDRDVTFVGHAVFRVAAHQLARAGIASLRFDKRGVGESSGEFSSAGPDEFVADVIGAAVHLIEGEGFSRERTGLVGHSEGGIVALTAASRMERIPFCVLMASPLLSGRENFARSFALFARGSQERDAEFDGYASDLAELLEITRGKGTAARSPRALEIADRLAPRIFNDRTAVVLGANRLSGEGFLDLLSSGCLETCLSWEPSRIVPLVGCPLLLIHGSMDIQAPALENLEAARMLLRDRSPDAVTIREVPGMNHAFQRCTTGLPDEYAEIDHVMADEVLEEVAAWIQARLAG